MANMAVWHFGIVALSLALVVSPAFGKTEDCTADVQETDSAKGAALLQTKGSSEKEVVALQRSTERSRKQMVADFQGVKVADKKARVAQHAEGSVSEKHVQAGKVEANATSAAKEAEHSGVVQLMLNPQKEANSMISKVKQLADSAVVAKQPGDVLPCETVCPGITEAFTEASAATDGMKDPKKAMGVFCKHTAAFSCAKKQLMTSEGRKACPIIATEEGEAAIYGIDCFCTECPGLLKVFDTLSKEDKPDKCSKLEGEPIAKLDCSTCEPVLCPYQEEVLCMTTSQSCSIELGDQNNVMYKEATEYAAWCAGCKPTQSGVESKTVKKSNAVSSVLLFAFVMGWHAC